MVAPRLDPAQFEMRFAAVEPSATATIEEVERLVNTLREHGKQTATQVCQKWGLLPTENNKRKIRAIAEAARPGIISFPSSAGYKLASDCTIDELNAAVNAWDSIIRKATVTKKLILDLIHSRGGAS